MARSATDLVAIPARVAGGTVTTGRRAKRPRDRRDRFRRGAVRPESDDNGWRGPALLLARVSLRRRAQTCLARQARPDAGFGDCRRDPGSRLPRNPRKGGESVTRTRCASRSESRSRSVAASSVRHDSPGSRLYVQAVCERAAVAGVGTIACCPVGVNVPWAVSFSRFACLSSCLPFAVSPILIFAVPLRENCALPIAMSTALGRACAWRSLLGARRSAGSTSRSPRSQARRSYCS